MSLKRVGMLAGALAFVFATMVAVPNAVAQAAGTVSGQVTDAVTGLPLQGARILVEGSNLSATTNSEGRFQIRNVDDGPISLRVIAIGYESLSRTMSVVSGVAASDFELNRAVVSLDDIVVTATGEQRRREVANATTNISAAEVVAEYAPTNMAALIQGRAAGVQILNSSGTAGTSNKIRIRGSSSVSLSNEPLLVVDGIRVNNRQSDLDVGTGGQETSRMNDFNPDDIESIEIVKGPSAAALYGTQAANGVIVITTKRGTQGAARFSAYMEQGMSNDITEWPANYRGLAADGSLCRLDGQAAGTCTQASVRSANPLASPTTAPFTTGYRQQYGLNVRGGSEAVTYFVSSEWEHETGIMGLPQGTQDSILNVQAAGYEIPDYALTPSQLKRGSFRANVQARLSDATNLNVSSGYVTSDTWFPQNDNNVTGMLPSGLLGGTDSTASGGWGFYTPEEIFFIETTQGVERTTTSLNLTSRPNSWLELRGTAGIDDTKIQDQQWVLPGTGPAFSIYQQGFRNSHRRGQTQYSVDLGATVQSQLGASINSRSTVGVQFYRTATHGVQTFGEILAPGSGSQKTSTNQYIDEDFGDTRTLGVMFEEHVGINDKLFLTGAVRADDNSAFGENFDVTIYPKLGASYMVSEGGSGVLDELRLRGAFGASGQQPEQNAAIKFYTGTTLSDDSGQQVGVSIQGAGNPELMPERSTEIEVGVDAGLFDGRVGLEGTFYRRRTTDALIQVPLPPSLGLTANQWKNVGVTLNSGFEAVLNAAIIQGNNFNWDMTLSGSTNSNELVENSDTLPIIFGSQQHRIGYTLGGFWDETYTYDDANGDGIIELSELTYSDSTEFIGYFRPRYEVSFSNSLELGQYVRLSGLFDYRGGHKKFNLTEAFRCGFNICQPLNDPTTSLEDQANARSRRGSLSTDFGFIEPGWFVKLRELSLTFRLPASITQKLTVDRLDLVITGRNLLTITDYKGADPEVEGQNGNFTGRDFLTQPQVRYWTARFNVAF